MSETLESLEVAEDEALESAAAPLEPRLPFGFASQHQLLLHVEEGELILAYRDAPSLLLLREVRRYCGRPFALRGMPPETFAPLMSQLYQKRDGEAQQVADDLNDDIDLSQLADEIPQSADLMDAEDDAPVIRLINAILSQAAQQKASDIHIETFEENLVVRLRIDGVLREILAPRRQLAPLLVSRLKVMANLDIAEKRIPQDGRISVRIAGHGIDIRMSTIPSAHGERVVLRLLDKQAGQLSLSQMNMGERVTNDLKDCLRTPHGIVLVTGPTGSGKTTTLYAGLSHINDSSRNILTIEDPVEYVLKGIGQTQVNTKVDMTFSRGLRAILRQDPDVVMIGEIRDVETAEIAVQASLTGHLVLSTLHTNTAIGAVSRLLDMGVESFLLSSSLLAVIAQRLVRVLCDDCKEAYSADNRELELLGLAPDSEQTLYRAVGCSSCNHGGFQGRTGIYELIKIDEQMRQLIHDRAGDIVMEQAARERYGSIFDDGRRRILAGDTTLEEVLRVTRTGG
ncbi:general secretion pathway protein E [Sinobacterium caligoides]|uniref:Type II secretion system protein E n=1 Tax=Sinobacterium caligoides TaxID=933926 RepID=A0A3N2DNG1_9GAMM|nr:type II secretion system ATPase GspE [Sinobacterium caligoides]ROS01348.1 general secretion pathway protein E [Sinobacterium caligoides]